MDNRSVTYGLYAGLGIILVNLGLYFVDSTLMINYAGYLGWAVYLACMVMVVKEEREELGGYIDFKQAFKITWVVFIIGSVLETVFGYVLINFIDTSILDVIADIAIEQTQSMMEMFGAPEDDIEDALAQLEEDGFEYKWWQLLMGYGWRLAFPGAVFAAIVALIFKRTKEV